MDSTSQKRLPAVVRAHCDVFQAHLPWQVIVKLYKGSIFVITETHPKSDYVTTKLHGTSTCGCNNNAIFSDRAMFTFPTVGVFRRRRNPPMLILPRHSLCRSCQSTDMATLLNSISFVFKISFLPKYCVIYYVYTVKWCSLINFNWYVWLDIV